MGIKEIRPSGGVLFESNRNPALLTVLAIVLLIFIVYIVYCHCCHEDHRSPAFASTSTTLSVQGPDHATTINSLPILIHRSSASGKDTCNKTATVGGQTECSICLSLFEDREMLKVMPKCQHAFHCVCVDKWLSKQSTCPLCRENIVSNSSGK